MNTEMNANRAMQIVMKPAKAIGLGKIVRVKDEHRNLMIEALDVLARDKGPDAILSTAMGVSWQATRRECAEMLRGRLDLRPKIEGAF